MATRPTYSEDFKRNAVELYENHPTAGIRPIARDLGVHKNSLESWIRLYGTGKKSKARAVKAPARSSKDDRERLMEKRLKALEEENEILRKAAQYFAREMNF